MQAALRERYNEMKRNFDKITLNLVDCEGQVQALAAEKLTASKSLDNLSSQLAMERNLRQSLETNLSAQTTKLLNMEENETRKILHARQREQETEELRLENARVKTELEKANTLRGELMRLMNKM